MNEKQAIEMAQAQKNITENFAAFVEGIKLSAKLTRGRYLALKREGFSEEQALNLCWRV